VEQLEVIKWIVRKLEEVDLRYFITGSIASSYYGVPRFTHDIDILLAIGVKEADEVFNLLRDHGYISKEGIAEALSGSGMFNFIHGESGLKIDFWISKGDLFETSCFARCRKVEISQGFFAFMGSPEDVLLHKIYWDHLMPSERQIRDAQGIIAVQASRLDVEYIMEWAKNLGIKEKVETLLTEKKIPNLE
jgi:hypothetical protein